MATSTTYNVELRDKNGNLKGYLTPWVTKVQWEWNRLGGCGRASITLTKGYRSIEFGPRDDIQIRVKNGSTSKLVYRGWIGNIKPTLKVGQDITLDVRGYFDILDYIVVHDSGGQLTYTDTELSVIVTAIADTFITPNSSITKGTIDASSFSADLLQFKTTVSDALKTLAQLAGDAEYGVDENLVFFWRTESTSLRKKFFVGIDIASFERATDWSKLVNKYYLQGGDVDGSPYLKTADASDSQTTFFLSEAILSNSAIITDTVADQYLGSLLKENSHPRLNVRAKIPNTDYRIEDTVPLGLVAFIDKDYDQSLYTWGTTANGGSDLVYGTTINGGSEALWGSFYKGQIDRISYSLSDTDGRFNIEIQMGDTVLETAAKIRQLETQLASLRER